MRIDQIPLDRLSVSKANMRQGKKPPDVADIQPSVIRRGVISPLFVRPNRADGHFEIVAGKRRYCASLEAAKQRQDDLTLPCIVLVDGDDADALEVSMIENMLRQAPDPVTQWKSYTRLVKEGRTVDDIAATFALTELQVKRILALGNLLPRIREAFRAEEIDAETIRHLTLATKAQQKAWPALFEGEDSYAPRGSQLKAWLFGGGAISVKAADVLHWLKQRLCIHYYAKKAGRQNYCATRVRTIRLAIHRRTFAIFPESCLIGSITI